jgi:hypothetical protein
LRRNLVQHACSDMGTTEVAGTSRSGRARLSSVLLSSLVGLDV